MVANAKEPTAMKLCICCHGEFSADLVTCPKDGTTLSSLTRHDLVGTVLADRYEVLSVIGNGGMGLVYSAKHRFMNRSVAIKVLHKSHNTDQTTLKRFQLEAQAASALSNPNIVTIYDFGTLPDGEPYMVMDLLEGRSLADVLESGEEISVARAINIFLQVCHALGHAHGKGIIHRDIKPSNIMLIESESQPDFVKVVDFGIAKLLDSSNVTSANLTRTGEVFGSPMYMSPEQWQGHKLDARADIYALGAVMYKVLSRKSIFEDGDMLRLMYKHVGEMPVPFAAHDIVIAPELEAIVFKALAKEPDARFQSMSEMSSALQQVKETNLRPPASSSSSVTTRTIATPPTPASKEPSPAPDTVSRTIPIVEPLTPASSDRVEIPEPAKEQTIQISIPKRLVEIGLVTGLSGIGLALVLFASFHNNPQPPAVKPPTQTSSPPQVQPVAEVMPQPEKASHREVPSPPLEERKRAHYRHPPVVKPHLQHASAYAPAQSSSNHSEHAAPRGITKLKNGIRGIKRLLDSL